MQKQTTVDWFISELQKTRDFQRVLNEINQSSTSIRDIILEAKQMEKEKLIEFADNYVDDCVIPNENMAIPTIMDVPHYYNSIWQEK
jgi:hypothetical protein